MLKRFICFAFVLVFLLFAGSSVYSAKTEINIPELKNCRKIAAYSGNFSAFFYGCRDNTLYSVRVLPNRETRYVSLSESIYAISHDETTAYALCVDKNKRYSICKLNMQTGIYTQESLNVNHQSLYSLFAAADNEIFVVTDGNAYSYVIGLRGDTGSRYEFSGGVKDLFVNGGSAYALLHSGEIYRIGSGKKTFCCNIGYDNKCYNAGTGYIFSGDGRLISLTSGDEQTVGSEFTAKVNGVIVKPGAVRLFASAKDSYAVMYHNFSGAIDTVSAQVSANAPAPAVSDGVIKIAAGTTVASLKSDYPSVAAVYNSAGTAVGSGLLKTGFFADVSGKRYSVAVLGDLTANGKIGASDVSFLMKYFIGNQGMENEIKKAADYNNDGSVDNKDLLLMSKLI